MEMQGPKTPEESAGDAGGGEQPDVSAGNGLQVLRKNRKNSNC